MFFNEQSNQSVLIEPGWAINSLDMARPALAATCQSTAESEWTAGNTGIAESDWTATNSDGVVPVWTTQNLDDFEPNLISCVLDEPTSSCPVTDNNVELVDELNRQSLIGRKEGREHSTSAVDPFREDREQSARAVNFQGETHVNDV